MSKCERAKEAARVWHQKYKSELERSEILIEQLKNADKEISRWKSLAESLPDDDLIQSLEENNKDLSKSVKTLKKRLSDLERVHQDEVAKMQRDRIILDGKIQHLEESCKQKQERYEELRDDYRYSQRMLHDSKV
jgi:chromosome segregation ATPase